MIFSLTINVTYTYVADTHSSSYVHISTRHIHTYGRIQYNYIYSDSNTNPRALNLKYHLCICTYVD